MERKAGMTRIRGRMAREDQEMVFPPQQAYLGKDQGYLQVFHADQVSAGPKSRIFAHSSGGPRRRY